MDYQKISTHQLSREAANEENPEALEALKEILIRAKQKDSIASHFIIRRYESLISTVISKGFFLKNGSKEDLYAEGLLGLNRAINDFDDAKGNTANFEKNLENFFYMCIRRSIITAINTANRLKNAPLNEMTSLDRPLQDNDNITIMDVIASKDDVQNKVGYDFMDPEEQYLMENTIKRYTSMLIDLMSDVERDVWELRIKGHSYEKIRELLGYTSMKKVDNAIQRIHKKLEFIMEEEDKKTFSGLM